MLISFNNRVNVQKAALEAISDVTLTAIFLACYLYFNQVDLLV